MSQSRYIVYMTVGDRAEALRIGRVLIAERLAACVNVLGTVTSLYDWNGGVEEGEEVAFLAKTSADRVAALTARVRDLHSYDCPCVAAVPVDGGNPDFLAWIDAQTRPAD
jgi:periplasmic divalent cation tolerance protein